MKQGTNSSKSSKTEAGRAIDEALSTDGPVRDTVIGEMNDAIAMLMKKHGRKATEPGGASDAGQRFKVSGSAMAGVGIFDGDTVLVDDQIEAKSGDLVVVSLDGLRFEVRSLLVIGASTYLHADDPGIPDEDILRATSMRIHGVVTGVEKSG